MRLNKIPLITVVAVTALIVTLTGAAPANALTGQSDVQKTIQAKTGKTAAPMTTAQKAGNVSIGAGRSAGKALESYTQTPDAKSTRVLVAVEDASQSVVTYPVSSPPGTRVEPQADGSLNFVQEVAGPPANQGGAITTSVTVTTIHTPWAVDANGKSLPTTYAYANGVLTQKLNTIGATFPVVADPWITFGTRVYVHLNPADQRALITGGALGAAAIGAAVCIELGPGDVICAVGAAIVGGIMASYISDYYHPRCTVVIAFNYWGGIAGRSTESCT